MNTKSIDNKDQTIMEVAGQVIQMVWQSSGAKLFLYLIGIVCFFAFLFSFKLGSIGIVVLVVALGVFIWWVAKFLMNLTQTQSELFQDSKTWYQNQRLLYGSKSTGLHELSEHAEFVQPILTQTRGNILTEAKTNQLKALKEKSEKAI